MTDPSEWRRDLPVGRADVRSDVDAELEFHRASLVEDLIKSGMSADAAQREATARLGGLPNVRREMLAINGRKETRRRWTEILSEVWGDIRYAVRTLRKAPLFTTMAIASLGIGIGVTSTILSAGFGILVRALPYPHANELVSVYARQLSSNGHGINISYQDYVSWRDQNRTFANLGMWSWWGLSLSGEGEPERVDAAAVTANLFPALGVAPALGRGFTADEEKPGAPNVVILSDALWKRRYGADRSLVGRAIRVEGVPYTVVGIMPESFAFPDRQQAWVPFPTPPVEEGRGNRQYAGAVGRLKPGVTIEQAQADLDVISGRLQQEFRIDNFGWDAEVFSLHTDYVGDLRKPLQVFLVAVALVLLIVCANMANLMLARGADRQREIAVRIAIGAGRKRLVRQLMTESGILALAGGLVGAAIAVGGLSTFGRLAFRDGIPPYFHLSLDRSALAIVAIVSTVAGILFGTLPALRASQVNLAGALKEGARGGDGVERSQLRRGLVVTEFALAFALMIAATLLVRSYRTFTGTDLGFDEKGILSFRVRLPEARYDSRAKISAFYEQLLDKVRAIPSVEAVGSAQGIPLSGWNTQANMSIEGRPARTLDQPLDVHFQIVTPDYFKAIGVPLLKGRGLAMTDRDTVARVAVINDILAKREFPNEDPIGKRIKFGRFDSSSRWITIVGVIRGFQHYRLPQEMSGAIYLPFYADPVHGQTLAVRTTLRDPHALMPAVSAALASLDPEIPPSDVVTFQEAVDRSFWRQRLQGQTLGLFAGLGLLLAVVGIYGVISYSVAQRSRELGVRMALGASGREIQALVIRQGLVLALVGTAIGLVLAIGSSRFIAGLLYGVKPHDPSTFIGVGLALTLAALVASYVPARAAAAVDPLLAMRAE